jgi:hypothetical protein
MGWLFYGRPFSLSFFRGGHSNWSVNIWVVVRCRTVFASSPAGICIWSGRWRTALPGWPGFATDASGIREICDRLVWRRRRLFLAYGEMCRDRRHEPGNHVCSNKEFVVW